MPKRRRSGTGARKRPRSRRLSYRKKSAFSRRKSFSKKRAPVVECKKKEVEPGPPASVCTVATRSVPYGTLNGIEDFAYVPETWIKMTRGFNEDEMVGRDLFLKWLHVKIRLNYNHPKMLSWIYRTRVRVIHGWVMLPGCVVDDESTNNTDYEEEVKTVLKNEMNKVLSGPDKTKIRILSDRMLTRGTFSTIDSGGAVNVPRRSQDLHLKWSPMRKIRYDQPVYGEANNFLPDPSVGLWIPFYCLWDQSSGEAPAGGGDVAAADMTHYQKREEMYFSDS